MIEGAPVDEPGFVEAFGNRYQVAERVAQMPLMKFAKLAKQGKKADDMDALATMWDLLRGSFTDEAWEDFENDATEARADAEELFTIVSEAIQVIAARPIGQPSDSSAGLQTITPSSTESSFYEEHKRALGLMPMTPDDLRALVG